MKLLPVMKISNIHGFWFQMCKIRYIQKKEPNRRRWGVKKPNPCTGLFNTSSMTTALTPLNTMHSYFSSPASPPPLSWDSYSSAWFSSPPLSRHPPLPLCSSVSSLNKIPNVPIFNYVYLKEFQHLAMHPIEIDISCWSSYFTQLTVNQLLLNV